ncbi:Ethylene-responsive transcription factor [Cardamine amara subsp. amara]|uniref:Ethylene-responsive transcription factor n=1 Tax=Cardamine amara subsp. amara TaxID=228776 RepID=A0ABD1C8U0_CARAN
MDYRDAGESQSKYKGIRRRKWGKWVSEIRVPGTRDRLWLGSFSTAEGAAVAHDVAFFCLHQPDSLESLNFPHLLPPSIASKTSPRSIQQAASNAGMAIDAGIVHSNEAYMSGNSGYGDTTTYCGNGADMAPLNISVYDYLDGHDHV